MAGLDFLAVVSRPDFPSGSGPVGDYYGLRRLIARRPDWRAAVIELNSRRTDVVWDGDAFVVSQDGTDAFDVADVGLALYLPICLEVEETLLSPIELDQPWPRFAEEQWRPITAFFEDRLAAGECLNRPDRVRVATNKLRQLAILRAKGFALPETSVGTGWPADGPSTGGLVAKNVSEGGWKSADVFSPARLVHADENPDPWPVIWQRPIVSDRELRAYVMGDDVTVVELSRHRDVIDVRSTNHGKPSARIVNELPSDWVAQFHAMTSALGLDYAVIDAIPTGDVLQVLEVNANCGITSDLSSAVGSILQFSGVSIDSFIYTIMADALHQHAARDRREPDGMFQS